MPVFKNEDNGTWYVMARYVNWNGERKQKCKRGFATKKEAQEWERMFQLQNSSDLDMSFEAFTELYINDVKNRLKENTWLTKEHIIRTKILPYFGKLIIAVAYSFEISCSAHIHNIGCLHAGSNKISRLCNPAILYNNFLSVFYGVHAFTFFIKIHALYKFICV